MTSVTRIDSDFVIHRLEEAGKTLLALPGNGYPAGYRTYWPEPVVSYAEAYGYNATEMRLPVPSAQQIDRMDEAWRWLCLIPLDRAVTGSGQYSSRGGGAFYRRIILMRSLVSPRTERHIWSWRKIATSLGCDRVALQQWHGKGIDIIVRALRQR